MSEIDKQTVERLANAVNDLPPEKQQYILGYAEGVADMANKRPTDEDEKSA